MNALETQTAATSNAAKAQTNSQERLVGIDVLRGIAVLMVVLNHIPHYAMGGFRENPFFFLALLMDYGYLGVSLFVIISGFCIHRRAAIHQNEGNTRTDWIAFWKRRFWRLYPPYLVAILLSLGLSAFLGKLDTLTTTDVIGSVARHLFMLQNVTSIFTYDLGNGVFWSLGMEEQLYLLYIPLLAFIRKAGWLTTLFIVSTATLLWRYSTQFPACIDKSEYFVFGFWPLWPFSFWYFWTLGALSVDGCFNNIKLPAWVHSPLLGIALIAIGFLANTLFQNFIHSTRLEAYLPFSPTDRDALAISSLGELMIGTGFFIFLNICVQPEKQPFFENRVMRLLSALGKISYSVYLTHFLMISLLMSILPFEHTLGEWILRLTVYFSLSILTGVIFYHLVEIRFLPR